VAKKNEAGQPALIYTLCNRIIYRMKITALLPDQLVSQVKTYAKGKTLTESLTIALQEWLQLKKVTKLNQQIEKKPLEFEKGFTAEKVRTLNRRS